LALQRAFFVLQIWWHACADTSNLGYYLANLHTYPVKVSSEELQTYKSFQNPDLEFSGFVFKISYVDTQAYKYAQEPPQASQKLCFPFTPPKSSCWLKGLSVNLT